MRPGLVRVCTSVSALLLLAACSSTSAGSGHGGTQSFPSPHGDPTSAFVPPSDPAPSGLSVPSSTITPTTSPPPSAQPSTNTDPLGEAEGAVFDGSNSGGTDLAATTSYLVAVVGDVDGVWSKWFTDNSMAEPMVAYQIVQPQLPFTSKCPLSGSYVYQSTTPNAIFCDLDDSTINGVAYDGTLVLPVETFAQMWSGNIFGRQASQADGDFAAAVLTAHEYGHKVQEQLSTIYGVSKPANPNLELIADCFAGVWAYVAFSRSEATQADIQIALNALAAIGDNLGSHGTNAERDNAFQIGLNGTQANPVHALPSNCTKSYWPALPMS